MKMKTKSSLLLGILALAMISGIFAVVVIPVSAYPHTFTVSPSGGDDTLAIQKAFDDAIAAGSGSTVKLEAGQFYTNEILVENFYGRFKGAGKDATKIDVLRGLDPGLPGVLGFDGSPPHIFSFIGGNVRILDLCFEITPFMPAEEWIQDDVSYYDVLSPILIGGEIISRIENIRFVGHEGTSTYEPYHPLYMAKGYNVRAGVILGLFGALNTGRHVIKNCEFDSLWLGISAYQWLNSKVKIKSNSITGGAIGIINAENSETDFDISGNYIESNDWAPIWVLKLIPSPCKWRITGNTLKPSVLADGILFWDYSGSGALEAVVSHNKIYFDVPLGYGGIWTSFVQDASIYGNIIHGTGGYGIGGAFTNDCLILGNSISNSEFNGMYFYQSSSNFILGNTIINNEGWGLVLEQSNDNCIIANIFYNNALGNIYDDGNNKYRANFEF
jgi:parallel beta-helix repeat protein